ncbi:MULTISPECIES: DMT family transporter [Xenorhabdus]|uniref:Membrane protein n=1 Tax=Xenorhabdus ehlersii TaxID=290111 RepID=A0A2D0IPB2_9GAMM|nr:MULTISPECIES: DMT family transporter [Xenorhabdus]MBC8950630.1 membrane protein [Xenorhabdus sp. TS4]PHM23659.1 membrane protein [Xenorhabdus ehlersii]RKE92737.1 putative membrane protein [Xenorhabdus ehlersii]
MTTLLFLFVLGAALLHASWNALVKISADRFLGIAIIVFFAGIIATLGLFWVELPSLSSLPWLIFSAVLHTTYCLFLSRSYATGDLGQVYPIARGCAPLITALFSWVILQEMLPPLAMLGVGLIIVGIMLIAFPHGKNSLQLDRKTLIAAIITSAFTAGYTLSDGAGSRASDNTLTYILWLFAINGWVMGAIMYFRYWNTAGRMLHQYWKQGVLGGLMQLLSYGIVIWAMGHAPIVLVAALRETSVLFAMLLSVVILREPFSKMRLLACIVIVAGVIATKLG